MSELTRHILEPLKLSDNEINLLLLSNALKGYRLTNTWKNLRFWVNPNSKDLSVEYISQPYKNLTAKLTSLYNFIHATILYIPTNTYMALSLAARYLLALPIVWIHAVQGLLISRLFGKLCGTAYEYAINDRVAEFTLSLFTLKQAADDIVLSSLKLTAYIIAAPLTLVAFGLIKLLGLDKKPPPLPKVRPERVITPDSAMSHHASRGAPQAHCGFRYATSSSPRSPEHDVVVVEKMEYRPSIMRSA